MGLPNGYQLKWLEESAARHKAQQTLEPLIQSNVVKFPPKHPEWVKLTIGTDQVRLNFHLGEKS